MNATDSEQEVDHISDDGLTALCGESLVDPDPPERPLCEACQRASGPVRPSLWARFIFWKRVSR